ncbi:hypothetical protein ACFVAD_13105 [Sutcliffiella sp. NPDC057660]|uniref:hypothetical protein n=1 Tax=Sutcliffiella sp. NPDC057660 TaxID=3346199 RepID=UPI003687ED68
MDKNHLHEVKIRINGKEKSFHHHSKRKKGKKQSGTPVTSYQDHVQEDIHMEEGDLPLIIVDETAAAAEKKEEEDFEWVLPKEPVKQEKKTTSGKASYIEDLRQVNKPNGKKTRPFSLGKKKLSPPSFSKQLILSIVMAIGIGTCLGFLILAIMNISSDNPLNPAQPVAGSVSEQADKDDTGTTGKSGEQSVTIPEQGVAVLQGGALSNMESANATIETFKSQGFSAVAVGNDTIYVLVGVGQTVEGMKRLGAMATDKGLETYAKDFSIPERTFNSLTAQDATVLQEGQSLYTELAAVSSSLLQGGTLDSAAVEKMNGHYEKISAVKAEEMTDGPKQWKDLLVGAYQHIQQYQTSKETSELWDAQQKLLEATAFLYQ